MTNVVEFKKRPNPPTSAEIKLHNARISLAKYLSSQPDATHVAVLIRDCFKYLLLSRPFDTMLLQRLTILFNKTKEDVDNGLGQAKNPSKTNKRF